MQKKTYTSPMVSRLNDERVHEAGVVVVVAAVAVVLVKVVGF